MATALRKTGISVVGEMPWGTHFCHFYETKQDLLDTLVPYFKAGLESKEFCLWVVSNSELITVEEAKEALEQAVPDLDRHLSDENIEILDGHDWYLERNVLNLERVRSAWDAKLNQALARGYDGLRASADTFWLAEKDWKDFFAYEKQVNDWITDQSMTVLCTYPLAKSGAAEVLDVVRAHRFAIARRQGEWEVIETPELIQAKAEIKRLNEELEQRVIERTSELKQSESRLAQAQRVAHVGYWERNIDTGEIIWSDETYRIFGLQPQEPIKNFEELIHPEDRPVQVEATARTLRGEHYDVEYRVVRPDGEVRLIHSQGEAMPNESGRPRRAFGTLQDVTELKRTEAKLKETSEQLRALSASLESAREEEATRIARELHDELGATLSILRWDLEDAVEVISESTDLSLFADLRKRIDGMIELTDTTLNAVRRIVSELRPIVLDELGLSEAIEWQLQMFQSRTGIISRCECLLENLDLKREQSNAVFRILQEALTNVLRHAQATEVEVRLKEDVGELTLTITDNGRGITEEEKSGAHSLGLLGMRERAHLLDGKIDIRGTEGKGTVVTLRLPIGVSEQVKPTL